MATDRDVEELQAKLAFAEDLLDTLNLTVARQQQAIDRMERELRALRRLVQASLPADDVSPGDEIPPHW